MKLISYLRDAEPRTALYTNGQLLDLNDTDPEIPSTMRELLARGIPMLERCTAVAGQSQPEPAESYQLLPPVPDPRKIICVGLNYRDHAQEMGSPLPDEPVIFNKFPTALAAHEAPIRIPRVTDQVDYEGELVAVIGQGGRRIPANNALWHVAGYCCGHDVSARDWQKQKPAGQWLLGKSFDTFAPLGPALVTADEVDDPGQLEVELRINGEVMQHSNTSQFIFPLPELIAYVSQVCTLEPGDLIFTGTPPGVGMARKPPRYLAEGDTVEVEIERVGLLRNHVICE